MSLADEKEKIRAKALADEIAAEQAAKRTFDSAYHQAILDTAKAGADRARSAGELVEKAASAIGVLYAAVIGVAFSVKEHPIPARALIPVVFLGLAIVCAMVYLAFPTTGDLVSAPTPTTSRPERMRRQTQGFLALVHELVGRRRYFSRAAVVALGVGVMCLPTPFIDDPRSVSTTGTEAPPGEESANEAQDVDDAAPATPPTTAATTSTTASLPSPPVVQSEAEATLAAIRYKAEIDAAIAARSPTNQRQENWPTWAWVVLIGGLVATFGVPALVGRLDR